MTLQSTTIHDRRVYTQDSAPSDTRDGVLWVDTSVSPPDTYTYDGQTGTWEAVAPGNVTISDSAPTGVNDGHIWVDTSKTPPETRLYNGSAGTWYDEAFEKAIIMGGGFAPQFGG